MIIAGGAGGCRCPGLGWYGMSPLIPESRGGFEGAAEAPLGPLPPPKPVPLPVPAAHPRYRLTAHQKAVIDEISAMMRNKILESGILKGLNLGAAEAKRAAKVAVATRQLTPHQAAIIDNMTNMVRDALIKSGILEAVPPSTTAMRDGLGDTLKVNLPEGALDTINTVAKEVVNDPRLKALGAQVLARAQALLASQGGIYRRI